MNGKNSPTMIKIVSSTGMWELTEMKKMCHIFMGVLVARI